MKRPACASLVGGRDRRDVLEPRVIDPMIKNNIVYRADRPPAIVAAVKPALADQGRLAASRRQISRRCVRYLSRASAVTIDRDLSGGALGRDDRRSIGLRLHDRIA